MSKEQKRSTNSKYQLAKEGYKHKLDKIFQSLNDKLEKERGIKNIVKEKISK